MIGTEGEQRSKQRRMNSELGPLRLRESGEIDAPYGGTHLVEIAPQRGMVSGLTSQAGVVHRLEALAGVQAFLFTIRGTYIRKRPEGIT
eukprot:8074430-Prorocentrum_lima.AAC.1